METRLTYQQPVQLPSIHLPSIPTDAIKEAVSDATLAFGISVASKPLFDGVALPQPRVLTVPKAETFMPVAYSFLSALKYSLYAVLFILWFVDSTVFLNYEGGLIGFVADCLTGFAY